MDLLLRIVLVVPLGHHLHTFRLHSVFAANTRPAIHRPYPRDVVFRVVFLGSTGSPSSSLRKTREQGYLRWLTYPAATLSAIGLILWGISIDRAYHWIVDQVAFFLFSTGIQMGNSNRKLYCRLLPFSVNVNGHLLRCHVKFKCFH